MNENLASIQIIFLLVFILIIALPSIIGMWKTFQKAGRQGWEAIVPVYNYMVMAELAGKPSWWGVLCIIPYAGIIFQVWIKNLLCKKFNKDVGYTLGLVFLPFIFWPILGFGSAVYEDRNPIEHEIDLIGKDQEQSS
ncbi:MAG: hypothetical protein K2Q24_03835 [Chitinophagaceae bacterium]|jgi:hypothetical protein|nr:hypothetical protein [Chitinophagaceae bacterium]